MGRRSRHSAKSGDQAMYKSRTSHQDDNNVGDGSDDDQMYDEVDRFHNRKEEDEFLQLDGHDDDSGDSSSEDDGITKGREGVFDLGVGGSSDEEESDDDEEIMKTSSKKAAGVQIASSSDDDDSDDEDDDDEEEDKKSNLLNWGAKKHSYYHGDTADLEIGQDVDDAYLEEEAGREVEKARLEDMEEGDFMLSGDEDEDEEVVEEKPKKKKQKTSSSKQDEKVETIQASKNIKQISKLSKKDKMKLLKANHPELLPLVQHFSGSVQDLVDSTMVAGGALLKNGAKAGKKEAQAIGATTAGLQYLISKSMLQASKALNLSLYLLLKADQASNAASSSVESDAMFMDDDIVDDVRNHPVIERLNQLSQLTDKLDSLEESTSGLKEQFSNLVKAAALVDGGDVSSSDDEDSDVHDEDNVHGSDNEQVSDDDSAVVEQQEVDQDDATDSASSDSEVESEEAIQRRVMTEARFALRNQDIDQDNTSSKRKRRLAPSSYDYGDETEELTEKAVNAGRKLASTMNSLSQKSAASSQKKKSLVGDEVERDEDDYEQLQRGLSMMEAEFGGGSDDGDDDVNDGGGEEEGFGYDDDDDDFYQKIKSKSMAKKKKKKEMYAVAPKYPRLDDEVEGERTIGRTIMKNRGLVAHKPKINRNPRVKKREQYRKALIRRKGAVREIRTEEGHVYGGESTGIKSGISRSRKL